MVKPYSEAHKMEGVKQLGNLPAFFIENQGQMAEWVKYYFKGKDNVYFTDEGVVFQKTGTRGQGLGAREQGD
jgi:hypothetical protein